MTNKEAVTALKEDKPVLFLGERYEHIYELTVRRDNLHSCALSMTAQLLDERSHRFVYPDVMFLRSVEDAKGEDYDRELC